VKVHALIPKIIQNYTDFVKFQIHVAGLSVAGAGVPSTFAASSGDCTGITGSPGEDMTNIQWLASFSALCESSIVYVETSYSRPNGVLKNFSPYM